MILLARALGQANAAGTRRGVVTTSPAPARTNTSSLDGPRHQCHLWPVRVRVKDQCVYIRVEFEHPPATRAQEPAQVRTATPVSAGKHDRGLVGVAVRRGERAGSQDIFGKDPEIEEDLLRRVAPPGPQHGCPLRPLPTFEHVDLALVLVRLRAESPLSLFVVPSKRTHGVPLLPGEAAHLLVLSCESSHGGILLRERSRGQVLLCERPRHLIMLTHHARGPIDVPEHFVRLHPPEGYRRVRTHTMFWTKCGPPDRSANVGVRFSRNANRAVAAATMRGPTPGGPRWPSSLCPRKGSC
jgi:hypothetical protein